MVMFSERDKKDIKISRSHYNIIHNSSNFTNLLSDKTTKKTFYTCMFVIVEVKECLKNK